jgi:hypothetical protein
MFVSSSTIVPGKLGEIAVADKECQRLASNASLPGTYKAWISTVGTDAKARVGNGGWVRTDGRPFAKNLAALANQSNQAIYYPPRLDETGKDVGNSHVYVATGGLSDGSAFGSQCGDYNSPTGGLYVGDASDGSYAWAMKELDSSGCGQPYPIYCFRSDGLAADTIPPPQPGRRIFVSAKPFVPGSSVSPDQMCQADAASANLANASQFLAFLATSTTPAIKRLGASGMPWKRVDDVFVVRQISDFAVDSCWRRPTWLPWAPNIRPPTFGQEPATPPCLAAVPVTTGRQVPRPSADWWATVAPQPLRTGSALEAAARPSRATTCSPD